MERKKVIFIEKAIIKTFWNYLRGACKEKNYPF